MFTGLRHVGKSGLLTPARERRENRCRVVAIDMESLGSPCLDLERSLARYCLEQTKDKPGILFLDESTVAS